MRLSSSVTVYNLGRDFDVLKYIGCQQVHPPSRNVFAADYIILSSGRPLRDSARFVYSITLRSSNQNEDYH